jgi:hypothetical protein
MNTLVEICEEYVREYRPDASREAAFYAGGKLPERIERAARAKTSTGKTHSHQRRIGHRSLKAFAKRLAKRLNEIATAPTFDDLLKVVTKAKLPGVGELALYDTAVRIGHGQKLVPEEVYLHAGTRNGAIRRGLKVQGRTTISMSEIRKELPGLSGLSPAEVEDVLCIFFGSAKRRLRASCSGNRGSQCYSGDKSNCL